MPSWRRRTVSTFLLLLPILPAQRIMRAWLVLLGVLSLLPGLAVSAEPVAESPLVTAANSSLLWGTYRPGLYFGLKPRIPDSLLTGLVWFGVHDWQSYTSEYNFAYPPPRPRSARSTSLCRRAPRMRPARRLAVQLHRTRRQERRQGGHQGSAQQRPADDPMAQGRRQSRRRRCAVFLRLSQLRRSRLTAGTIDRRKLGRPHRGRTAGLWSVPASSESRCGHEPAAHKTDSNATLSQAVPSHRDQLLRQRGRARLVQSRVGAT